MSINLYKPYTFLSYHASLSDLWDTTWFSVLEYTKIWFDNSMQQFLICRNKDFFLWTPQINGMTASVEFFVHIEEIQPSRISYARKSLDSQMLAVQHSNIQLSVFHIESKKRWKIEIKSPEENRILNSGVLWSEHGGNSQDLILVTSLGLELYKVSSSRAQCKLSHIINYKTIGFAYEPNYRMIFLMIKSDNSLNSTVSLKGFILPYDVPTDIPKFELPRPQSISPIHLNNNVGPDDITVTSLYSSLYCIVREPTMTGFSLSFYALFESRFIKTHVVDSVIFSRVCYSVSDNVVYVHCMEAQTTLVIDVSTPIPHTEIETPLCPSFLETASLILEGSPGGTLPVPGPHGSLASCSSSSSSSSSSNSLASTRQLESPQKRASQSATDIITAYWNESDSNTNKSSVSAELQDNSTHLLSPTNPRQLQYPVADSLYSRVWQSFPASAWAWDPATLSLWRLRCCLPSLVASPVDAHKVVSFLACRGQVNVSPKPVTKLPAEDPLMVKRQILLITRRVFRYFSRHHPAVCESGRSCGDGDSYIDERNNDQRLLLHCFLAAAMNPYVSLIVNFKDAAQAMIKSKATVPAQPPLSVSTFQSLRVMGIFANSVGVNLTAANHSSTDDTAKIADGPLEPLESMHALLPEVLAIGKRAMPLKKGASSQADRGTPSSSNSQRPILALNTRRDLSGRLLVTQTELLSHVFLSLLQDSEASLHSSACIDLLMTLFDVLRVPTSRASAKGTVNPSSRRDSMPCAEPQVAIKVEPSLCILLLKLLVADNRLQDVVSLIQLRYFSESTDFALVMLELADSISTTTSTATSTSSAPIPISTGTMPLDIAMLRDDTGYGTSTVVGGLGVGVGLGGGEGYGVAAAAVHVLRLAGLDMLWRLRDRPAVVRWLLSHERLGDAIALCLKDQRGQWQQGLEPPDAVPGAEFFFAAVERLGCIPADRAGKKVELMYTVSKFLAEWDEGLLRVDKTIGRSRLAAQAPFPAAHFSARHTGMFREMLGYR